MLLIGVYYSTSKSSVRLVRRPAGRPGPKASPTPSAVAIRPPRAKWWHHRHGRAASCPRTHGMAPPTRSPRTPPHRQPPARALAIAGARLAPTTENHPCSVLCRWLCAPHEHNYTATAPASASRAVCVARNTEWDARSPCLLPRATDDGDHSALGRHGTRCYASSDARMTPTALDACASCYYCLSHCYGGRANHLCDLS